MRKLSRGGGSQDIFRTCIWNQYATEKEAELVVVPAAAFPDSKLEMSTHFLISSSRVKSYWSIESSPPPMVPLSVGSPRRAK
jgi:hypothetical protein